MWAPRGDIDHPGSIADPVRRLYIESNSIQNVSRRGKSGRAVVLRGISYPGIYAGKF